MTSLSSDDLGTALVSSRSHKVIAIASLIFYNSDVDTAKPNVYMRVAPYLDWIAKVQRKYEWIIKGLNKYKRFFIYSDSILLYTPLLQMHETDLFYF